MPLADSDTLLRLRAPCSDGEMSAVLATEDEAAEEVDERRKNGSSLVRKSPTTSFGFVIWATALAQEELGLGRFP